MTARIYERLDRLPPSTRVRALMKLRPGELHRLAFRLTAHPAQTPPPGDWSTWLFLGGRGAGKTRAGAQWLAERLIEGARRVALVGPTLHDVREVMVEGPSGLRVALGRRGARYEPSRRRFVLPNGAAAYAFSAEDPDSLRGPQFEHAWADEMCAWKRPDETLAMLRMGLRLGERPRLAVTTTPRPIAALRRLIAEPGLTRTHAPTRANARHLSPAFLAQIERLYGGTRREAQELEGLILESEAALFRYEDLARARGPRPERFDKAVVAVDPPAGGPDGSACGIVAAARAGDVAYVLDDLTVVGASPDAWARRVVEAARRFDAAAIVAEVNQGGDMVEAVLKTADPPCPVRRVRAASGKRVRAEPVAALYEQGRVVHLRELPALEEELLALGEDEGRDDRADALVWALTALMLEPIARPRVRRL